MKKFWLLAVLVLFSSSKVSAGEQPAAQKFSDLDVRLSIKWDSFFPPALERNAGIIHLTISAYSNFAGILGMQAITAYPKKVNDLSREIVWTRKDFPQIDFVLGKYSLIIFFVQYCPQKIRSCITNTKGVYRGMMRMQYNGEPQLKTTVVLNEEFRGPSGNEDIFLSGTITYNPVQLKRVAQNWVVAAYRLLEQTQGWSHDASRRMLLPLTIIGPLPMEAGKVTFNIPKLRSKASAYSGPLLLRAVPCDDTEGDLLECTERTIVTQTRRFDPDQSYILINRDHAVAYTGATGLDLFLQ